LVELSPQGIMTIDNEGFVQSANPAVENLHGFSLREILGKHFTELPHFNKSDIPQYQEGFKSIMEGKSQPSYEYKLTHKDGTERWAVANIGVLKNKGRIDGFLTVINDITERKLMEEALRVNQERFQAFMESAPVTLTIYDSDLNYIDANQNLLDLYGYTREFLIGRNMEDLHPDTVETGRSKLYRNLIRTGEPLFLPEVRSPNKLGDRVFSIWAFKVGEGMGLISTEITENKNYEYKLRESEEKYRGLFDLSPFAIVISDMKGRITDVNDAVIRMAGFPRDELIGKHFSKLPVFSKRDIPRYLKIFSSFLNGKPLGPLEIPVQSRDGNTGTLELHASFVEADGEKIGIQAVFKDVTLQKETEEKLRRENAEKKATLDAIPDAVSLKGIDYRFIWVNEALAKSASTTPEKLVGKICYKDIYGRQKPHDDCPFRKVLESGQGLRDLMTFADGRVYDVAVEPVCDDSGKIIAAMEISRDISIQIRMEEELRRSEER
ncbi:MAG: PAS domain-containing protein, partial [Spirochaetia bacterium]